MLTALFCTHRVIIWLFYSISSVVRFKIVLENDKARERERERERETIYENTDSLKYDNIPLLANQIIFSLGKVQGAVQADSVYDVQLTKYQRFLI